jgi:di/tricarboxylate transporter
MDLAVVSILGLAIAIILSCTTRINVGILAIALGWIIGVYFAGMSLAEVVAGFPSQLFLTLAGVTLLFTQAKANGTLDKVANRAVRGCRGSLGLIPIMFFFLAFVFGSIGPGSIAAAALIGPMAMAVAGQTGIPVFLMAIMVANGANSASLSPIGPTGIIVNGLMDKMGLTGFEWRNYVTVFVAHAVVAFAGYIVFGGLRLFRAQQEVSCEPIQVPSSSYPPGSNARLPGVASPLRKPVVDAPSAPVGKLPNGDVPDAARDFEPAHWLTLAVIATLVISVIFFDVNVGMAAMVGAVLLVFLRAADEATAIRTMPWGPILMVSGVTLLVGIVEKTGGMDLFSSLLARFSSEQTVTGFVALLTGSISIYSSTSGVVLPAFLPTVPGLIEKLGAGDIVAIAYSMIVGAHLVDVSPLSTTGALCIAAVPPNEVRQLFRQMLAWGISMAPIAAIGCYIVFGLLWR